MTWDPKAGIKVDERMQKFDDETQVLLDQGLQRRRELIIRQLHRCNDIELLKKIIVILTHHLTKHQR